MHFTRAFIDKCKKSDTRKFKKNCRDRKGF